MGGAVLGSAAGDQRCYAAHLGCHRGCCYVVFEDYYVTVGNVFCGSFTVGRCGE